LQSNTLFGLITCAINAETTVTDQIAAYFLADFLNTPRLTVDGESFDLTAASQRNGELALAQALWQIRKALGPARANRLIAFAANQLIRARDRSDSEAYFKQLLLSAASGQEHVQVAAILRSLKPDE
jgi:hypothetical protein